MKYTINYEPVYNGGLFVSLCSILETCWLLMPVGEIYVCIYIYISIFFFYILTVKFQKALKVFNCSDTLSVLEVPLGITWPSDTNA